MTDFTVTTTQQTPVKLLFAEMQVRYWEDAKVNGEEEDNDAPKIPLRDGEMWSINIDLATGVIAGWPDGVTAETHYKVCDAGVYHAVSEDGSRVASKDGYVPSMLSPGGSGYGDYVIMKIDGSGKIENWSADLSYFETDED